MLSAISAYSFDDPFFIPDPTPNDDSTGKDSLKFPIEDKKQINPEKDGVNKPTIDLNDPSNIRKEVTYAPEENRYYLNEKVGDYDIKNPTYMSAEEYLKYRAQQDENDYWKQRLDALSMFNQKPNLPTLYKDGIFNRLFGSDALTITPQGNLDLTFGGSWQNMKNPALPQRAQRYGIFDFDMNMNVNLLAQIGDKMKLNITNNTQPSFGEQNVQKLEYTGKEDEIIKKIEAGNVSFPLRSNLISGVQTLFGFKTQLQFGKLWITGVLSQQRSQRKSITVQGGGQSQEFEVKADDYDENRNFLLAQHFHDNYETALAQFPLINSQVVITKVDLWITNRTGVTQGVRDIASFMDLGEKNPYMASLNDPNANHLPDNRANRLYTMLQQNQALRSQSSATQTLINMGLMESRDFHRSTMRQLNPNEYTFHPQLGYVSLNTTVNPDDILAVSYRYTYNGQIYQVGEFAEEMPPDSTNQKVMFMKMLKGTASRPTLPIWKLMMKNVYSIGTGNVSQEDFMLNVFYLDPGGGQKRYMPEGSQAGTPLIRLLNLDRLNPQNDPAPDGIFDFVDGITIVPQMGKIIFPVLEPFGKDLKPALDGNPQLERRYLYQILYDSTKTIARQFQQNNRFIIKGRYKGNSGSDIMLGGFNIPQGSVSVTAGGQKLTENVDYTVDYNMGRVKIINQGVLNSGVPVNIAFEDNATFGLVQQNFWGVRADYNVNQNLTIGGTMMRLTERPFTQKVMFGDDPIKNTVAGLDVNYQSEAPFITRTLDKILPFYSTTAPSLVSLSAEVAGMFPGHHKFINAIDPEGSIMIDDFEGANSSIDLRFPAVNWFLASTPVDARDIDDRVLFPEAMNINTLSPGFNRAKLSWYTIDNSLVDNTFNTPQNIKDDTAMFNYWRIVGQQDIFPDRPRASFQATMNTFDLTYFPDERGPYNFSTQNIDPLTGKLLNPKQRWAGIQRALDNNNSDFEASNVEYITFWVLDPFLYHDPQDAEGELYINLGNVSEDVLKDSRLSFENGIPYPEDLTKLDQSVWGRIPKFQQQITRAFETDPAARAMQDVGYDALDDESERNQFSSFLSTMEGILGPNSEAFQALNSDPASDNYKHFRGKEHDDASHGVLERYKNFTNPQGNSPVADINSQFTMSGTVIPESEDINKDNTLNETESYYQYRVSFRNSDHPMMQVGQNNIVNRRVANIKHPDGRMQEEVWYQFKIPIRGYDRAIGGIGDFRSIRFFRMFLNNFSKQATLRFAELQLERNQWRGYLYSLKNPGENIPEDQQRRTSFAITSVSVEQHSGREPVQYKTPPGVQRQQMPAGATGQILAQDEQSMAIQLCRLEDGDARAAFKETRIDMRQSKYLRMFVHAESVPGQSEVQNGDLHAFIRIGSDFVQNYYEYRIPLTITQPGENNTEAIWPEANRMDVELLKLVQAKANRNAQNIQSFIPYYETDEKGNQIVVMGNPNLGEVRNVMLGVLNPKKTPNNLSDDGLEKCAEIWFNEMRMAGMDEKAGYAAAGQANIQLADLGNVSLSGSMHTVGYGNIDQKLNQRFRDDYQTFGVSTNLNFGKLLPRSIGLQLPVYVGYNESVSNPQYDPYDMDIELKDKLKAYSDASARDSVKKAAQDFTSITSMNLSNVRYTGNPEKQPKVVMPWSLRNFDFNYSFNKYMRRNPLISSDELIDQKLGIGYMYDLKAKPIEPFKKKIKSKSKWLQPIKDFNFTPIPSSFTFRNDLHKVNGETNIRNIDGSPFEMEPLYFKNFLWDRAYNLRWELTKSFSVNYTGLNQGRVDEPYGELDSKEKKDTLWNNIARLGRTTFYNHTINTTYNVPTKKIPALDWTTLTLNYNTSYNWTAASRVAYDLGNTIANTQNKQINANFQFTQLYNKSRWLKAINTPKPKKPKNVLENKAEDKNGDKNSLRTFSENAPTMAGRASQQSLPPRPEKKKVYPEDIKGYDTLSRSDARDTLKARRKAERKKYKVELKKWKAKRKNTLPDISDGLRVGGRIATMLKRVTVDYSEQSGTVLPGFMDSSQYLGVNTRSNMWYDFALGYQPDQEWFDKQAQLSRISSDSIFNGQLQQQYAQNFSMQATVEPFPQMRIDLSLNKRFSKNYTETFKYDYTQSEYSHLNPYTMGSFNVSYIGINTMFKNSNQNYRQFMDNRTTISQRLGRINPYTNNTPDPQNNEYAKGYTEYSQEVLIPAFLAAYSNREASDMPLMNNNDNTLRSNPFKYYYPMPNWKITYNGLTKIDKIAEYFKTISFTHNYSGTMSMNSFVSNFFYNDFLGVGFPSFIDSNSNNYIPFFQIPNITINENFSPILGVDMSLSNEMSFRIMFNKSRMLSMSLIDYQVSETKSTEFIVGFGHRLKGLTLPFEFYGITRLENDINIRVDVGYRDDITTNTYFALDQEFATRGQSVLTIQPSIDYIINESLQIRLFYDRRQSIPHVDNSFPITNTRAGITLRFLFAPQ